MIKGLEPRLAEAGKIKIGGLGERRTAKSGKEYRRPEKWDHFKVTSSLRDRNGDLTVDAKLMKVLPKDPDGKCREIPVVLHSDDIEEVFPTAYNLYAGRALACRGDGELATRWRFEGNPRVKTGKCDELACPCPFLTDPEAKAKCKPHGTLHCSIATPGHAVAGAVHKWRTASIISIQRMLASLQQILQTVGTLRGLPLVLKLEAVPTNKGNVFCCHVELRANDIAEVQRQLLERAQIRQTLEGKLPYKMLVAPPGDDSETPEEQEEIYEEFHQVDDGDIVDGELEDEEPEQEGPKGDGKGANAKLKNLVGNGKPSGRKKKQEKEPEPEPDDGMPDFGGPEE